MDIRINLIGIPSVPELFDGFKFLICLLTSSVIGLKKKELGALGIKNISEKGQLFVEGIFAERDCPIFVKKSLNKLLISHEPST